jgi:PadR family transcriptional regulator, regulatory protein PadR
MTGRPRYLHRIELLQGTLDLLILRTLQWSPRHGHGVGLAIQANSDDVLRVDHGSLYPALHRLQRKGWIAAEWRITENGQRAKYYRLTAAGRKQLALEQSRWQRLVQAMTRAMRPARRPA